jgi:cyclopropane fatty-acyl-phospholipid synthase-like methyltransferase
MDIGANTGKFTLAALGANASVKLHLVDLPGQLAVADKTLQEAGLRERASLHPTNLLDDAAPLPGGMDLIWMSQFLSCFSEDAIASIFRRVAAALAPNGQVLIMDTFWDRQRYDIASYFNNLASGNSKVYESGDYVRLAQAAGLDLVTARDGIGYCHSLLRFAKAA